MTEHASLVSLEPRRRAGRDRARLHQGTRRQVPRHVRRAGRRAVHGDRRDHGHYLRRRARTGAGLRLPGRLRACQAGGSRGHAGGRQHRRRRVPDAPPHRPLDGEEDVPGGLPVSARESLRIGLVDEVADADGTVARAIELARSFTAYAGPAQAGLKRLIDAGYGLSGAEAGTLELEAWCASYATDDARARLREFFARGPDAG